MEMINTQKEIYFHVGLGKVASTYLQKRFFPNLKGLEYIPTNRYKNYEKYINQSSADKLLISREFDNQLEYEVRRFAEKYPQTNIIIAFRRHDEWMASQYRRYIKNGGHRSFSDFFDVEKDKGLWKINQVEFLPKIEIIKHYFPRPPLVLFHEDLKRNPNLFFAQIANYTKSSFEKEKISLSSVHKSYSEKQLKFIRTVAKRFFQEPDSSKEVVSKKGLRHWLKRRSKMLACYSVMYGSFFFPEDLAGEEALIPQKELDKVRVYFEDDWRQLKIYANHLQKNG